MNFKKIFVALAVLVLLAWIIAAVISAHGDKFCSLARDIIFMGFVLMAIIAGIIPNKLEWIWPLLALLVLLSGLLLIYMMFYKAIIWHDAVRYTVGALLIILVLWWDKFRISRICEDLVFYKHSKKDILINNYGVLICSVGIIIYTFLLINFFIGLVFSISFILIIIYHLIFQERIAVNERDNRRKKLLEKYF